MSRRSVLPTLLTLVVLALPGYALVQSAGAGVNAPGSSVAVHEAPSSIDRSGKTDVTAAINAFIASVPDGSTITFPPSSLYRVEGVILVGGRHNLVIDGAGSTFFATTDGTAATPSGPNMMKLHWPRHRNQWFVYNSSHITAQNLIVRGANLNGGTADAAQVVALEAQAGFEFYSSTHSVLQNCTISYTYGDLVYVGNNSSDIIVKGCTLSHSGRQGVTVADATRVALDHNAFSQIRRSAVDLEPFTAAWSVTNVWIVHNTFSSIRLDTVAAKAEGDVSNIVIAYNHLVSEPMSIRNTPGVPVTPPRHDWYAIGNSSDTPFGSPHGSYWITDTVNVTISGNYQPLQPFRNQIAIETTGSTNVKVSGNSFPVIHP